MITRFTRSEKWRPLYSLIRGGCRSFRRKFRPTTSLHLLSCRGPVRLRNVGPVKHLRLGRPTAIHGWHGSVEINSVPGKRLTLVVQLPVSSETLGGHGSFIRNLLTREAVASDLGGANMKKMRTKAGTPGHAG